MDLQRILYLDTDLVPYRRFLSNDHSLHRTIGLFGLSSLLVGQKHILGHQAGSLSGPSFVDLHNLTHQLGGHRAVGLVLTYVEVASQTYEVEEVVMHGKAEVATKAIFGYHQYPFQPYFLVFLRVLIYLFPELNFVEDDSVKRLDQAFVAESYLPYLA